MATAALRWFVFENHGYLKTLDPPSALEVLERLSDFCHAWNRGGGGGERKEKPRQKAIMSLPPHPPEVTLLNLFSWL